MFKITIDQNYMFGAIGDLKIQHHKLLNIHAKLYSHINFITLYAKTSKHI